MDPDPVDDDGQDDDGDARLLQQLAGGDRRSIGASNRVVDQVLARPGLFSTLVGGLTDPDPVVRMRCADAAEKVTARQPALLQPHKLWLINLAATAGQQELRWHLAQMLPRLALTPAQRRRVLDILIGYETDASRIVRTFAMQAMADLAMQDAGLRAQVTGRLRALTATGSPAMRSRGRRLLAQLDRL